MTYNYENTRCTLQKSPFRVLLKYSSEQYNPQENKMWLTLSWPQRGFHHSVTVRMPAQSMVHETAFFLLAWRSITSSWVYVLGFAFRATHYNTPCTCLTTPFNAPSPPPLSLHKYNQPCRERQSPRASSIVSDWLCRTSTTPASHHPPCLQIASKLGLCQGILLHTSYSHTVTSLGAHPPIHQPQPPLVGWQSPSDSKGNL